MEELIKQAPEEIHPQLQDNINWIRQAKDNKLVVGSQARILYADSIGRIRIAETFNEAVRKGVVGPIVLGRDHHDVSGTDSPYRETSNIYDGSRFTADMAIHNVIGDSFRGATWVSIHNGGGVGWGEVINGGFGLLLDGSKEADLKLKRMLYFDVNNGIARRAWAGNPHAVSTIQRENQSNNRIQTTMPFPVSLEILSSIH
jgi:urocanate hydratase